MKKHSYEFVKGKFEEEGCELLSRKYTNNYTKLRYICPNGHKHSIMLSDWLKGRRCVYCFVDRKKQGIDFIRKSFKNEGYILLDGEYVNNYTKMDYICNNGHSHSISWNKWTYGRRCPYCAVVNNTGPGNPMWKGGISCEPYCDAWADKVYKEDIKARDNYECQNPDCWRTSNRLILHHIDYNKKNCHPFNLITLCRSCNSRANADRAWHKEFYENIMKKKYKFTEV